jgi:hypothetical protein
MQVDDAVISSIRKVRHQISEEQAHDPQRVVAYYLELQKQYRERLLESPVAEEEMQSTEA